MNWAENLMNDFLKNDFLGDAAIKKKLGKQAIKDKKFDDAWRFFHEQKSLYLKHASRSGFDALSTLVIDASVHEDLANILRLEGKYRAALTNISYVYKTSIAANRPITTLEKKLKSYFIKVYDINDFVRFKSLLKSLKDSDFISVRDFVEEHFPKLPKEID
ncbi:MAG: hypothetical protein LWW88_05095 [Acinetobacter sp.]|uniref:hypothetical protein n=1 Tax=Acinetobacter sp. TaxID=472 RepID=UPI00258D2E4A|nr:hypothetical protein [Acinetobacter sp.]MCE1270926.1 hypothetical protein [Acinetobacter sp.]